MKRILSVTGMTCDDCAQKISKNLFSLPEVEDAIIDLENNTIELELNSAISTDTLKSVIKSAGNYNLIDIK